MDVRGRGCWQIVKVGHNFCLKRKILSPSTPLHNNHTLPTHHFLKTTSHTSHTTMRPSDNIPIAAEEVIGFVMITFNALINELSRGIKVAFEEVTNDAVPYGTFHFDERGAQGASELTESTPADQRALHMAYRKFCRCDLFVAFNIKLVEWLLEGIVSTKRTHHVQFGEAYINHFVY